MVFIVRVAQERGVILENAFDEDKIVEVNGTTEAEGWIYPTYRS